MKTLQLKWRKGSWIFILLLIATIVFGAFATGAFHPTMDIVEDPFYTDTNVTRIEINKTYQQGQILFTVKALEIGDNFSVLLFSSNNSGAVITGADLYQNGERVDYLSAGTTTSEYKDNAIAFNPIKGTENIELRITSIKEVATKEHIFPIDSSEVDDVDVDVAINGKVGKLRVEFTDETCTLYAVEGMDEILAYSISGYPITPGYMTLMRDGNEMDEIEYSRNNPPNQIKIVTKEIITDGEIVVIPIS